MKKSIKRIVQGITFILIIGGFIYIGTRDFSKKVVIDNEKFDQEYTNVSKDNVFVYATSQEVYGRLKNGNAVIFMGFSKNVWSGYYADILNEAAKEVGLKEILYYDFKEDRDNKNGTYQSIVLRLNSYVWTLDDGVKNIYAPTMVIVKNGEIIAFDNETSLNTGNINPHDYWTSIRVDFKKNDIKTKLLEYLK